MKFKVGYFVFLVYYEYTQCHKQFKKNCKRYSMNLSSKWKKEFPSSHYKYRKDMFLFLTISTKMTCHEEINYSLVSI